MQVPTVGSQIKVRVSYSQGPRMIPPQPDFHVYEGKVVAPYKWLTDREFCMTGDDKWPVRVINLKYTDAVELVSGSMKDIKTDVQVFEVDGSKGKKYIVTRSSKGWTCTCTGYQFRKQCKHITELSNGK